MSRWFRHYAGMMRDEKLVRVAVRSKQAIERVVWVWGAILESASEINDGGRYELDAGEAAYFLRCDDADVVAVLTGLEDIGRVVAGVVAKWSDRQYDSDASRERQRRYRERSKANPDVQKRSGDDRHTAGDVTPPSRDAAVTPQETDTELDTDNTKAIALDAASPVDARDAVWTEGVSILQALTGKPEKGCRSLVGRWLSLAKDDCALVLSKIRTAKADRIGEPVPWITAAVQATAPPKARTMNDALEDIKSGKLNVFGLLNGESHEPAPPTIDASFERTDRGGVGNPLQIHAVSSRS